MHDDRVVALGGIGVLAYWGLNLHVHDLDLKTTRC